MSPSSGRSSSSSSPSACRRWGLVGDLVLGAVLAVGISLLVGHAVVGGWPDASWPGMADPPGGAVVPVHPVDDARGDLCHRLSPSHPSGSAPGSVADRSARACPRRSSTAPHRRAGLSPTACRPRGRGRHPPPVRLQRWPPGPGRGGARPRGAGRARGSLGAADRHSPGCSSSTRSPRTAATSSSRSTGATPTTRR